MAAAAAKTAGPATAEKGGVGKRWMGLWGRGQQRLAAAAVRTTGMAAADGEGAGNDGGRHRWRQGGRRSGGGAAGDD